MDSFAQDYINKGFLVKKKTKQNIFFKNNMWVNCLVCISGKFVMVLVFLLCFPLLTETV